MRGLLAVTVSLALGACGSSSGKPGSSATPPTTSPPAPSTTSAPAPSTTPTALSPPAVAAAFGIVVTGLPDQPGNINDYGVALVGIDGKTAAHADARLRSITRSGDFAAAILPETSSSDDRVYYLDGDSTLRWLKPDGSSGMAAQLPGSSSTEVAFAVSPDNRRIAVSRFELGPQQSFVLSLYVEDLGGGNRATLFNSTSQVEWPVGWHGDDVVIQLGLLYNQYGWGYGSMSQYHVANAITGSRDSTVCGSNDEVWGPPELAGTACSGGCSVTVQGWGGRVLYQAPPELNVFEPVLSVDGQHYVGFPEPAQTIGSPPVVYGCGPTTGELTLYSISGASSRPLGTSSAPWGWIDSQHLVIDQTYPLQTMTQPFQILDVVSKQAVNTQLIGRLVGTVPVALR